MLATLVALGTIVLVHQADSNRVFCTLIGAADGVQVSFDFRKERRAVTAFRLRAGKRTGSVQRAARESERYVRSSLNLRRVAVCIHGRCTDGRSANVIEMGSMIVPITERGLGHLEVNAIIDRRGRPLQLASGTIQVRRFEPNGPGCGTWWQGAGRVENSRIMDLS